MTIQTAARHAAITTLLETWQPSALAAVIVDALAVAGEQSQWDSGTLEGVVEVLQSMNLTTINDTAYWQSVTGNVEHPADCGYCISGEPSIHTYQPEED